MTHRRNSTIFFLQCIRTLLLSFWKSSWIFKPTALGWSHGVEPVERKEGEKERKMTPMLRPAWSMVLLHFRVDLSLRTYETSITRIRALEDYYVLSKVNTLNGCRPFSKGKPLNSNMVGWIYPFHPDTLIMIGWAIGGKVHIKSSARKTEWWPIWALVHKSCKAPRHFLILINHHLSGCSKFSKYMMASSTCCLMTLVKFTTCGRNPTIWFAR